MQTEDGQSFLKPSKFIVYRNRFGNVDNTKSILKPVKDSALIDKCDNVKAIIIKESHNPNIRTNLNLKRGFVINKANFDQSSSLTQTVEEMQILNSKNDNSVIVNSETNEVVLEKDSLLSNTKNSEFTNTNEKNKILGFARQNVQGQLIYTDLTKINENATNKIKVPSAATKKIVISKQGNNSFGDRRKLIISPEMLKKGKLIRTVYQKPKSVTSTGTQTSIYSLLSPASEMLEIDHLPDLAAVDTWDQNLTNLLHQETTPQSAELTQQSTASVLNTQTAFSNAAARLLGLNETQTCVQPIKILSHLVKEMPSLSSQLDINNMPIISMEELIEHESSGSIVSLPSISTTTDITPKIHSVYSLNTSESNLDECAAMQTDIISGDKDGSETNICIPGGSTLPASDKPHYICDNEISNLDKPGSEIGNNIVEDAQMVLSITQPNLTQNMKFKVLLCALKDMQKCRQEDDDGNIPVQKAVLDNDRNTLKRQCIILRYVGPNYVNHQNKNLDTALLLAVKSCNEDCIAILLNYGADQAIADRDGNTALHIAIKYEQVVCTRLLLAADKAREVISSYNDEGFAPIHLAAINGNSEIIQALVSEGADINEKDAKSGRTAYHHAILLKNEAVVKVLGGLGCNTGEPDFTGHLPMFEESFNSNRPSTSNEMHNTPSKCNRKKNEGTTSGNKNKRPSSSNIDEEDCIEPDDLAVNSDQRISLDSNKNTSVHSNASDNEAILPRKKRRRQNTPANEVLTLSSGESDDDCFVISTNSRHTFRSGIRNKFIPSKKRCRNDANRVMYVSDHDSNSDCEVVQNVSSKKSRREVVHVSQPVVREHVVPPNGAVDCPSESLNATVPSVPEQPDFKGFDSSDVLTKPVNFLKSIIDNFSTGCKMY